MKITSIKNEEDYQNAFKRLEIIFDSSKRTKEGEELEILVTLIWEYENEHYPIEVATKE